MDEEEVTNHIFTEKVATIDLLWNLLENRLPSLIKQHNIKLLIIDSIAALFRHEYSMEEASHRASLLWKHSNQLKLLSDSFNIPIVVVNQVSDFFNNTPIIS